MCYIVFIPRIQRPLRPASVFSMMMMMMMRDDKYEGVPDCRKRNKRDEGRERKEKAGE